MIAELEERLNVLKENLMVSEMAEVESLIREARLQYLTYRLYDKWTVDRLAEYGITLEMLNRYCKENK